MRTIPRTDHIPTPTGADYYGQRIDPRPNAGLFADMQKAERPTGRRAPVNPASCYERDAMGEGYDAAAAGKPPVTPYKGANVVQWLAGYRMWHEYRHADTLRKGLR